MAVRLATVAPDLVEVLSHEQPVRLRTITIDVCEWIVGRVGLIDPKVDAALAALREGHAGDSPERQALKGLADELDERAWDMQDRVEEGSAPMDQYLAAFALARAASAVWSASDHDPIQSALEAVYEAQAATGDLAAVRRRVQDVLA